MEISGETKLAAKIWGGLLFTMLVIAIVRFGIFSHANIGNMEGSIWQFLLVLSSLWFLFMCFFAGMDLLTERKNVSKIFKVFVLFSVIIAVLVLLNGFYESVAKPNAVIRIIDGATGQPVREAVVTIKKGYDQQIVAIKKTDDSGRATFENLPFEVYSVTARKDGRTAYGSLELRKTNELTLALDNIYYETQKRID